MHINKVCKKYSCKNFFFKIQPSIYTSCRVRVGEQEKMKVDRTGDASGQHVHVNYRYVS